MEGNRWRWSCIRKLIYFISTDLRSGGVSEVNHDDHGKLDDGATSRKGLSHQVPSSLFNRTCMLLLKPRLVGKIFCFWVL